MRSIRLAPFILVRLAGLPGALLHHLSSPLLADHWQRLAQLDGEIAAAGAPLCDGLHAVVARCGDGDPAGRTRVINLRRAIHNGRRPEQIEAIRPLLDPAVATTLDRWVELHRERERVATHLPALWAVESMRVRSHLQTWSGEDSFQAGLVLASESIWQKLQEYRATPLAEQAARLRKMEPALAMYLTRASGKTSPFSTFALLGHGSWVEGAEPLRWTGTPGLPVKGLAALNQAVLNRLATAAARHPALRRAALLRRGALVRVEAERILAYGRIDQAGNSRVAYTGERLLALPRSPVVERVLEQVGERAIPWGTLCQELGPATEWEPVLAFMLSNHLLETGWGIDESSLDFPGALAERLRPLRSARARSLRQLLAQLSALTRALPTTPAAERLERARAMTEALYQAFALVDESPGELATPPCFEECGLDGPQMAVGRAFWAPAITDLALLHRLLPLFAHRRVRQRAIRAAFVAQFGPGGRCTDLPAFLLGLPGRLPSTPDPAITALRERFDALVQAAATGSGGLDPDAISAIIDQIPPVLGQEPVGFGYFVQPLPRSGRLLLTEITPGFGRAPARFANLLAGLGPAIQSHLATALPPGSAFLDVPGTFGFNASRRPPLVDRELRYPGAESTGLGQSVALLDLHLIDDPATETLQLRSGQSGERLVPLDLHALTPMLGPELWARLMELQPSTGVGLPIQGALYRAPSDQVQILPQIRLGALVLARRTWIIPTALLPKRPKGAPDWEWASAVEGWRRANDLPQQVYIRATLDPAGRFLQGLTTDRPVRDQQRKPQFIDFSSPVLLRVFERHLEEAEELLVIEERLPGPADWLPGPDGEPRVMEWYLELDGTGRAIEKGGVQHVADDSDQLLGRVAASAPAGGGAARRGAARA